MAAFDDFLNAFSYNPETFNEEQFKAAISAAHAEDANAQTAIIAARDADLASRDQRIEQMGRDNWDLLMKQGPKITDPKQTPDDPSGDDGDPKPKSIESMFKKVERP